MGNTLKFNSSVCTSIKQSQRLLDLGLKPETADCMYSVMTKSYNGRYILEEDRQYNLILFRQEEVQSVGFSHYKHIPAWSLHRLIEMICNKECKEHYYFDFSVDYDSMEDVYDSIIEVIERHIKDKFFNKEYLKQ